MIYSRKSGNDFATNMRAAAAGAGKRQEYGRRKKYGGQVVSDVRPEEHKATGSIECE